MDTSTNETFSFNQIFFFLNPQQLSSNDTTLIFLDDNLGLRLIILRIRIIFFVFLSLWFQNKTSQMDSRENAPNINKILKVFLTVAEINFFNKTPHAPAGGSVDVSIAGASAANACR